MENLVLVLTGLSTALSATALAVVLKIWRTRYVNPRRRMEALEATCAELDDRVATAVESLKTVTQRHRMRVRRAAETQAPPDSIAQGEGETPEEWKQRMRTAIASGRVDPRKQLNGA